MCCRCHILLFFILTNTISFYSENTENVFSVLLSVNYQFFVFIQFLESVLTFMEIGFVLVPCYFSSLRFPCPFPICFSVFGFPDF